MCLLCLLPLSDSHLWIVVTMLCFFRFSGITGGGVSVVESHELRKLSNLESSPRFRVLSISALEQNIYLS